MADVQVNQGGGGGGANWVWAILVIVLLLVIGYLVISGGRDKEVKIEVDTPATSATTT